jgi:hypothetical protein
MRGSYSITNAFSLRANTLIQQGQEILLEGDNEWLNKAGIPLHEEYAKARKIVDSLVSFQSQYPSVSEEHWIDIMYRMKNEMVEDQTAANLLPSTLEELRQMASYGLEVTKLIPRDMSWIKKHGTFSSRNPEMSIINSYDFCRLLFRQHSRGYKYDFWCRSWRICN